MDAMNLYIPWNGRPAAPFIASETLLGIFQLYGPPNDNVVL